MLGLALSGGGHRATVFGMGALLAQADPECDRVLSISSVAGKSVANGLRNLQRAVAKEDSRSEVRRRCRRECHPRTARDRRARNGTVAAQERVEVSVLHAGFDAASYALMVGVYADEEMSGAERFLDGQFAELLSGWDMGRYPGALGTSVFVAPGVDVDSGCRPIGAYLVGLGTALTLNRRQLEFTVRQALVDRCVRLYPPVSTGRVGTHAASNRIRVGVASALLGVRDDESLRVEDAVAGILEESCTPTVASSVSSANEGWPRRCGWWPSSLSNALPTAPTWLLWPSGDSGPSLGCRMLSSTSTR